MNTDENKIGAALAGNLSLASVSNWFANLGPFLHLLLTAGQIGVAGVTIWYIIKKARQVGKNKNDKDNPPSD
jgi:energy-converting hydrogenase Eha subunit H